MNKIFKYYLITFCFYFLFILNVSAGMCDDSTVANPVDGTCNLSKTYRFKSYLYNSSQGYSVYKTDPGYSYSGVEEFALCIDPGKNAPYDRAGNSYDYNYVRDIETTGNDLYFYRIYQKYVNEVGNNYTNRDTYLKYVDIMSRYLIHHELPWSLSGSTYDKNKLLNNSSAKSFYDEALAMTLWENPLHFESSVNFDVNEQLYIFKIDVLFTNGSSQYFYDTSSGLINGDYNIGYGDGFFDYEFQINGGTYDFSYAHSYTGNISGTVNKWVSNPNNTLSFEMKMTSERYEEIFAAQGKVYLNLKYSTYNAMSDENVVFVKRHAASSTNQRMLVFTKYIDTGNVSIDGEANEDVFVSPLCKQNADEFYYEDIPVTIDEYKEKCGCGAINEPAITNTDIKNNYVTLCGFPLSERYSSTMNKCDSDGGNNTISHNYTRKVESDNNYCSLECSETINITGFADEYTVQAGMFFELDKYPSLIGTKKCKVNVFYEKWKADYESLLINEINTINKYLRDYAIDNAEWVREIRCGNEEEGYDYGDRWSYRYKIYSYDKATRTISYRDSGRYSFKTGGCGDTEPSTDVSGLSSAIDTRMSELNDHFHRLRACNRYLYDIDNRDTYYEFYGDLGFYYNQTYSKLGSIWNNAKPDAEDDDSPYTIELKNDEGFSSGYREVTGTTFDSIDYIEDTYPYAFIFDVYDDVVVPEFENIGAERYSNYEVDRTREFAANYEPSVRKYVDSFTGIISSKKRSLNNPVLITGNVKTNVYDTNVTAISKAENKNYYQFSTLGDKDEIGQYYNTNNERKLKRYCSYDIVNPLIKSCEDGSCESKLDIVFRIVDPNNLDPNKRLGTNDGFKNWNNKKGEIVLDTIQNTDTYNPKNLEYSFTLDSASIKKIREYNSNCDVSGSCDPVKYSSVDRSYSLLSCNDLGNECNSKFITELSKSDGVFGNVATNLDGRNKWKYLMYNSTTNVWSIEEKAAGEMNDVDTFKSLVAQYKDLGVDVTP